MKELATKWQPVSDIDSPFESIEYTFQIDVIVVRMVGVGALILRFSGVVAFRFEQECPGLDFLPRPLPMLRPSQTFPLLVVEGAQWLEQYNLVYKNLSHFALISSDHLVQLLAKPEVEAKWESKP